MNNTYTKAEQKILGMLLAAGGDRNSGSTIRDIQEATGLSHNTVYLAIRKNIPGVLKCMSHTNTGATMYYCTNDSIRDNPVLGTVPTTTVIQTAAMQHIWDSEEWQNAGNDPLAFLSVVHDKAPASAERIEELLETLNAALVNADEYDQQTVWHRVAIASQVIAMHSLTLAAVEGAKNEQSWKDGTFKGNATTVVTMGELMNQNKA